MRSFDLIAPYYDRLAALVYGQAIRKAHTVHLDKIPPEATILVVGGGTGWWLKKLLADRPCCTIWYVDASQKMLQQARAHAGGCQRVVFIHGNERHIPAMAFDVVITSFFLDMFQGQCLDDMISLLKGRMAKGGRWIVSDFVDDRLWQRMLLFFMYRFFKAMGILDLTRMPDWRRALKNQLLECRMHAAFYGRFIWSNVYEAMNNDEAGEKGWREVEIPL